MKPDQRTLFIHSPSGHIDTELYFQYIRHIEPFLCKRRPIAIFQDNLSCHENLDLVEFCLKKYTSIQFTVQELTPGPTFG